VERNVHLEHWIQHGDVSDVSVAAMIAIGMLGFSFAPAYVLHDPTATGRGLISVTGLTRHSARSTTSAFGTPPPVSTHGIRQGAHGPADRPGIASRPAQAPTFDEDKRLRLYLSVRAMSRPDGAIGVTRSNGWKAIPNAFAIQFGDRINVNK
jgi:hypothetical protein